MLGGAWALLIDNEHPISFTPNFRIVLDQSSIAPLDDFSTGSTNQAVEDDLTNYLELQGSNLSSSGLGTSS